MRPLLLCLAAASRLDAARGREARGCNANDQAALRSSKSTFFTDMEACSRRSVDWRLQWSNHTFAECLPRKVALSPPCVTCLGGLGKFGLQNCKAKCMMSSCTERCLQCAQQESAATAFEQCSGLPISAVPSCGAVVDDGEVTEWSSPRYIGGGAAIVALLALVIRCLYSKANRRAEPCNALLGDDPLRLPGPGGLPSARRVELTTPAAVAPAAAAAEAPPAEAGGPHAAYPDAGGLTLNTGRLLDELAQLVGPQRGG